VVSPFRALRRDIAKGTGIQAPITVDGSVKYSWFRTEFEVPDEWSDKQVQLNFQAVDYEATVFINVRTLICLHGKDLIIRVKKLDSIVEVTFDSGSMSPTTSSEDKRTSWLYSSTTQPIPRVMSLVSSESKAGLS
jgi:hypothetical protein